MLTVYGYIRSMSHMDIPDVLKGICLLFYTIVSDKWNPQTCHRAIKINDGGDIIEAETENYDWCNAFGTLIVKKGDIESWIIKRLSSSTAVFVGIVLANRASKDMLGQFCCPFTNQAGIGYYGADGTKNIGIKGKGSTNFASKWDQEETIKMTLDLRHDKYGKLSMMKGGEDLGILYDKIDVEQEYCLAISFFEGAKIQLCSE